ncbi:MAG: hypothetical protein ACM3KR_09940 [Deltaproteobacteria bacterium]
MNYYFEDFTESNYRKILILAKKNYNFISFEDYRKEGKNILWRHDIDFSVHRAFKLASIELEEKIKSTFFIHLHNDYYNALESEVSELIRNIINMGHEIGLHFDTSFYCLKSKDVLELERYLRIEKEFLEAVFNKEIKVFSFHNPDINEDWTKVGNEEIAGMINTYSDYFKKKFGYCSDSNGYWRHKRLGDILELAQDERLQVLTHPECWTPDVMSPRDRISRCIDGRTEKSHAKYDQVLEKNNRENIR